MCSWYDDITDYHSKETDDWYADEGNLEDPTKNRITVDQTVQEIIEISQLQHNDNVVNISVEEIVQVSQVQVMMKTNRDPTVTARVLLSTFHLGSRFCFFPANFYVIHIHR